MNNFVIYREGAVGLEILLNLNCVAWASANLEEGEIVSFDVQYFPNFGFPQTEEVNEENNPFFFKKLLEINDSHFKSEQYANYILSQPRMPEGSGNTE